MRVVRNFWASLHVDGRASSLDGGPRAKDGGISGTILVRHNGSPVRAVRISGRVSQDGRTLMLDVEPSDHLPIGTDGLRFVPLEDTGGFRIISAR